MVSNTRSYLNFACSIAILDRADKMVLPHIWGNINQFEIISPSYAIDQS